MQNSEALCEESERAIKKLKTSHSSLTSTGLIDFYEEEIFEPEAPYCIFSKLVELYEEESRSNSDSEEEEATCFKIGLKPTSFLLEKLVSRERLNTLIFNLYAGNKGYSLAFRTAPNRTDPAADNTANMVESSQYPYEVDDLLRHVDYEEIPPTLVSILEEHFSHFFYSGCIIAEIRDYRKTFPQTNKYDVRHVLLRPHQQSILADINNITREKPEEWDMEDKHLLESQMLLANNPILCLDPDKDISVEHNRINENRSMWNIQEFRRMARKFSQVVVNRKRKLGKQTYTPGVKLLDFLMSSRQKQKTATNQSPFKIPKKTLEEIKPISVPSLDASTLMPPSEPVVINEFKAYLRPDTTDCLPHFRREYVLETDMPTKDKSTKPGIYHIKLTKLQRPSTLEYLGELYMDRDHKENEKNGVTCRFSLGSKMHFKQYVQQFLEIFSESGRKAVRIRCAHNPEYKIAAPPQTQLPSQSSFQPTSSAASNLGLQHVNQLNQSLPTENSSASVPQVNGIAYGINVSQDPPYSKNTGGSNVSLLKSHLQITTQNVKQTQQQMSAKEQISAIAENLELSGQQFQAAAASAKQQQQHKLSAGNNATNNTIINLLNSPTYINTDVSGSQTTLLPQQVQNAVNQKLLTARKMNLTNARVLNHNNTIATAVVNNNRYIDLNSASLSAAQQPHTITLTSVNSAAGYTNFTTVPVSQKIVNRTSSGEGGGGKSGIAALLSGTPSADLPDLSGVNNTNPLLLEKLVAASSSKGGTTTAHFVQNKAGQQFMVQSSKVTSPLSSPPQTTNTINIQGINLAQFQNLSGVQNVQVVPTRFLQTSNLQGHPTSIIVSMPVTTGASSTVTQTANNGSGGLNPLEMGTSTVVLANAGSSNLAQIVTGMKTFNQQGMRTGLTAVSLSQGQPFQLITSLQHRPRTQANNTRTVQKPITIKMATNANTNSQSMPLNASFQQQQYQQFIMNQQQPQSIQAAGKIRRRSNASTEPQ